MTKIEWCDETFNPVTGCKNRCPYCYAEIYANRFGGAVKTEYEELEFDGKTFVCSREKTIASGELHDLITPEIRLTKNNDEVIAAYPYYFDPTFHRYRLNVPQKWKKPRTIFVGSMADNFGNWVPIEWIEKVFEACLKAPQHRYLFLTKNPRSLWHLAENFKLPLDKNFWYGTTATNPEAPVFFCSEPFNYNRFVSIEPLLCDFGKPGLNAKEFADWVIIGAETGNRKEKITPKREWVENIVNWCEAGHVPVFMKNSLVPIIGEKNMLRQFPWESKEKYEK
jgi:protein gp37